MAIPPLIITTLILTTKETQVVFVQRSEEMVVTCQALRVSRFKHSPRHYRIFPPASRSGSPISWSRIRIYSSSNHRIYRRDMLLYLTSTPTTSLNCFFCGRKNYIWMSPLKRMGFNPLHPWLPHCQAKLTSCKGLHKVIVDTNLEQIPTQRYMISLHLMGCRS